MFARAWGQSGEFLFHQCRLLVFHSEKVLLINGGDNCIKVCMDLTALSHTSKNS